MFLEHLKKYNPKTFLEIGVFCGVTAINTCNFLKSVHGQKFEYIGVDLFGGVKSTDFDEIEPNFLTNQKFSNPLKVLVSSDSIEIFASLTLISFKASSAKDCS